MNKQAVFIFINLLIYNYLVTAQIKPKEIKRTRIELSPFKGKSKFIIDETSGEFIYVNTISGQNKTIEKGNFKGMKYSTSETTISPSGKNPFKLKAGEKILYFHNNNLRTKVGDPNNQLTTITNYSLDENNLKFKKEKQFKGELIDFNSFKTGILIVSDYAEMEGSFIEIYSPTLDLLQTYVPYKYGFSDYITGSSNDYIYGLFASRTDFAKSKLILFDKNGVTKLEKELDLSKEHAKHVIISKEFIIINTSLKILVFDLNANFLWSVEANNPYGEAGIVINESQKSLHFFSSKTEIQAFNLGTGTRICGTVLPDLFKSNSPNSIIRIDNTNPFKDGLAILYSNWNFNPQDVSDVIHDNIQLRVINKNCSITASDNYKYSTSAIDLNPNKDNVIEILTDQEIIEYDIY